MVDLKFDSILHKFQTTILGKDSEGFCDLYDAEVIVFDMWQEWSYIGIDAWKKMVSGWFGSLGELRDKVSVDVINITEGKDMALVTAIVRFAAIDVEGTELRFLQNRFSWVLQQKSEGWKIIHQHSSCPVDFGTMKPVLTKSSA